MKFSSVPFLARVTPPAPPPGGLAIVQSPTPDWETATPTVQQDISAVGSGNALVVVVCSPTSAGGPTISDSEGGSWGSSVHPYAGANGITWRFYARANVTSGLTWVRATFAGDVNGYIAVVEVSGAGSAISLDDSDGSAQGTATEWQFPFTSTVDDVLCVVAAGLTNNSASTGVSPLTTVGLDGDWSHYGYGIYPTAGSNTAQFDLAAGRNGDKAWAVFRAGA